MVLFGWKNSLARFQNVTNYVSNLEICCNVGIDDIVVYLTSEQEYSEHLARALQALICAGGQKKKHIKKTQDKQRIIYVSPNSFSSSDCLMVPKGKARGPRSLVVLWPNKVPYNQSVRPKSLSLAYCLIVLRRVPNKSVQRISTPTKPHVLLTPFASEFPPK